MNKINQLKTSKSFRHSKRRGTSEIIAALLLVAITVVGAVILTVFLDDNFVAASENEASKNTSSKFIRLLGYDTRDSTSLFRIQNLNNTYDSILTGAGATATNSIPNDGGTEFLVMQIENQGIDSVWLSDVYIDGVNHEWDSATKGIDIDTSSTDPLSGKYPEDGKFSIVPVSSITQNSDTQIEPGKTVNLIVKLGPNDNDIDLNESIRVLLNIGATQPVDFVIESGDAK